MKQGVPDERPRGPLYSEATGIFHPDSVTKHLDWERHMTTPDSTASGAARFFGLDADASPDRVADVHRQLEAYLAGAPADLQPWAERQKGLARRAVEARTGTDAQQAEAEELSALGLDPELETPAATAAPVIRPPKKKGWMLPAALALLSAIVVVGVYQMGGDPQPQAGSNPSASSMQDIPGSTPKPVDPKMVKTLEEKIKKDPKDVLSMKALGQVYDQAGDYTNAAKWQQRVTEVTPKDPTAWLALGVAQFNGANLKDAEVSWNKAKELDPKQAITYYNLGFLYMSKNDMNKARENWQKVVDLDPKSDLAKSVQSHLGKASTPSAKASTTPSATPSR